MAKGDEMGNVVLELEERDALRVVAINALMTGSLMKNVHSWLRNLSDGVPMTRRVLEDGREYVRRITAKLDEMERILDQCPSIPPAPPENPDSPFLLSCDVSKEEYDKLLDPVRRLRKESGMEEDPRND